MQAAQDNTNKIGSWSKGEESVALLKSRPVPLLFSSLLLLAMGERESGAGAASLVGEEPAPSITLLRVVLEVLHDLGQNRLVLYEAGEGGGICRRVHFSHIHTHIKTHPYGHYYATSVHADWVCGRTEIHPPLHHLRNRRTSRGSIHKSVLR